MSEFLAGLVQHVAPTLSEEIEAALERRCDTLMRADSTLDRGAAITKLFEDPRTRFTYEVASFETARKCSRETAFSLLALVGFDANDMDIVETWLADAHKPAAAEDWFGER